MARRLLSCGSSVFAALISSIPAAALADSLTPEERAAIDKRLVHVVEPKGAIAIEEGDTVFIDHREVVPANRFTRKLNEYEGTLTAISSPKGIVVHARADELKLEPLGDKVSVTLRFAIHVDPGTKAGGAIKATATVVERTGLGNVVVQTKLNYAAGITPAKPKPQDLTADFYGYRFYQKSAQEKLDAISRRGLKGLAMVDEGHIPSLDRVTPEIAQNVYAFERDRRRMWIAHRHLIAARTSKNDKISSPAKAYLSNLDRPADQLSGLPALTIAGEAVKPAETAKPEETKTAQTETLKPERVETLKPERVEPAEGGAPGKGGAPPSGTLNPTSTYEPGSEGDEDEPIEPSARPREEQPKESKEGKDAKKPAKPGALAKSGSKAEGSAKNAAGTEGIDARLQEDILAGRASVEIPIPSYPHGLVLDDPNIAHEVSVRFSYAHLALRGTTGVAPAIFYHGQLAITRAAGIELTVPTAYVDVDVQRAQSKYVMGNPLISGKYRIYLPEVLGRMPALTLRARWAVPISPLNNIPPTQLGAEEFSFPAHFVDTYAFLLEKTDLGLGFNAAWQKSIVVTGLQFYGDYFLPVSSAVDQTKFPTLSYGASVGVVPFGDLLGVYLEGRATTLMSGPTRTEFFTYLGARTRFLDYMEFAAWGSLPIGSVGDVSSLQFGVELRFTYDMPDAISLGGHKGGDQSLLGE